MTMKRTLLPLLGAASLAALLAPGARADEKADALLKQVAEKTRATKTLSADLTLSMQRPDGGQNMNAQGTVKLMKPNYAHIAVKGAGMPQVMASTGKDFYVLLPDNQYQKTAATPGGSNINLLWAMPIAYFFNPGTAALAPFGQGPDVKTSYLGPQTVNGTKMEAVAVTGEKPIPHKITMMIGPEKLFRQVRVELTQEGQTTRYEAALNNLKTGAPMTAAAFAYTPPKTAKLYEAPNLEKNLVAVGKKAPAFALPTPQGGTLALENTLKDKKAVLVNFWFYN
jgi:outer membrane lipoprotein-sorting protein